MGSVAFPSSRLVSKIYCLVFISRNMSSRSIHKSMSVDALTFSEEPLRKMWRSYSLDARFEENIDSHVHEGCVEDHKAFRQSSFQIEIDNAKKVLQVLLQKNGPDFDIIPALNQLQVKVSGLFVREVLVGLLRNIDHTNKRRSAFVGGRFFHWSAGQQENYKHNGDAYHLLLKILAYAHHYKAMWRLVDEMTAKGFLVSARTFNILIATCGKKERARQVVARLIESNSFNYRPYKHSYNAILHALVVTRHYELIEWVYERMLAAGHLPDKLTYNVVLYAKHRLGKEVEVFYLYDEMVRNKFNPDLHTCNILLYILGRGNHEPAAFRLLDKMNKEGLRPSVLHFTTLMDALSRAGNIDACHNAYLEMRKSGCNPDVVCYTVLITGFVVAKEPEKAEVFFDEMISNGQLPNVYTYNSMIRGYCMAGKYERACSMIKEMVSRGCSPNFIVYRTLVNNLRNAGRLSEAAKIVRYMMEKGPCNHLVSKLKPFRRHPSLGGKTL